MFKKESVKEKYVKEEISDPPIINIDIQSDIAEEFLVSDDISADMYTLQLIVQYQSKDVNWNS